MLIYPRHTVFRTLAGGAPELLVVCGCGAWGAPAEVGWAGTCCGPCHDRQLEGAGASGAAFLFEGCCVAFSADGSTLAVGGGAEVRLHDLNDGQERVTLPLALGAPCEQVALGPDGRLVAVFSTHDTVFLWDVGAWAPVGPELPGWDMALAPDGRTLAVMSGHGATLWRVRPDGLDEVAALQAPVGFRGLCVGSTGARFALAEAPFDHQGPGVPPPESVVRVVGSQGNELARLTIPDGWVGALAFLPGDDHLVVGVARTSGDVAEVYDLRSGAIVRRLHGSAANRLLCVSPDGQTMVTASVSNRGFGVWGLASGQRRHDLWWWGGHVYAFKFSPDGLRFAVAVSALGENWVALWPADVLGLDRSRK
jgi:WD40 repeat protein